MIGRRSLMIQWRWKCTWPVRVLFHKKIIALN
jgi:hypothetical protein